MLMASQHQETGSECTFPPVAGVTSMPAKSTVSPKCENSERRFRRTAQSSPQRTPFRTSMRETRESSLIQNTDLLNVLYP